jgi:hypothetical protein
MKNPFSFETLTEQGQNLTKSVQSQVKSQLGSTPNSQQQIPNADAAGALGQDQNNQDFVDQLYGASSQQKGAAGGQAAQANPQQAALADQQRLEAARKKLHMETYYIPTFEQKKKEESTGERLEREENEKKQKEQEKMELEQKKNDVPKAGGKGSERTPGASG